MTARLHMESTAVGQANLGSYIGRDRYFKHDLILLIMPLAFNGSHRRIPSRLRMHKRFGGFGCNGQLAAVESNAAYPAEKPAAYSTVGIMV